MSEILQKIKQSFGNLFERYDKKQKIIMAIASLLIVLMGAVGILYITKPEYVVLYKDIPLEESGQVIQKLDELGVKYKIENENTILVQKKDASKAKIDLSMNGVPNNNKFSDEDLLNKNTMFMSDQEKSNAINYALQNRLSQDLQSIKGVTKAIVNLNIPKQNDFALNDTKKKATASVLLEFDKDFKATPERIDGMASFVANSVDGLSKQDVSIHGPDGSLLNEKEEKNAANLSDKQLALQNEVKEKLKKELLDYLEKVYGYGNVSVMANVKLNFDENIKTQKIYQTPVEGEEKGLIRSEYQKSSSNKETSAGGPAGTASNTGDVTQYQEPESSGSESKEDESKINYELNETIEKLDKAKGQIEDVTVSVILNSEKLPGKKLDDDTKKQIVEGIQAASGLSTKQVSVYAQSFNNDIENMLKNSKTDSTLPPMWFIVTALILILIPMVVLAVMFMRNRRRKQDEERRAQETPLELPQEEIDDLELDIKDSGHKKSIEGLIERNPEIVAQLLKSWIDEE